MTTPLTSSENIKGMLWMLLAGAIFSTVFSLIRYLGDSLHVFELVFLRNLFGFIALVPFLLRADYSNLTPKRPGLMVGRAVFQVAALSTWYYGLLLTPLATATALGLIEPIVMSLMAVWLLKELSDPARWLAMLLGFAGSLIIIRPGFTDMSLGSISVIVSAFFWAAFALSGKILSRENSALVVTAYPTALVVPMALVPALFFWTWPTVEQWVIIILAGALSSFANVCLVKAFQFGDVTAISPMTFARLIFSAILGFVVFNEVPEIWVWVGGLAIVAAGTHLARIEARSMRRARAAAGEN